MIPPDNTLKGRSCRLLFISGHGYGHITRMRHVVAEMEKRIPEEDRILVFCDTDPRFFPPNDFPRTVLIRLKHDIGLVQKDSFSIDYAATLRALDDFKKRRNALLDALEKTLAPVSSRLVLSDTSPFGIAAAKRLGIPGFLIGNFTWSDIYRDLVGERPAFGAHADEMDALYREADACWRLPLHTAMAPFSARRIEPIPWIAPRKSMMSVHEWERMTGVTYPRDRKVILCSFGGFDFHGLPEDKIESMADRYLFVTTRARGARQPRNLVRIESPCTDYLGLIKHAHLVVTKPGYGILSDCLVHRKPIVFCDRGRFAEYGVLAEWLNTSYPSVFLPRPRLIGGEWEKAVERALALERDFPEVDLGGASKTACLLEERMV